MSLASENFGVEKSNAITLLKLLQSAGREVRNDSARAQNLIGRASALLQAEIDRSLTGHPTQPAMGGLAAWQARRVRLYIEERLDQSIRVSTLSTIANLSATHFIRSFKQSFGETPHSYIVRCRLERARHLMLTTEDSLSEIAVACGFTDQAHLTRSFRQSIKQTPAAWRRQSRQAA